MKYKCTIDLQYHNPKNWKNHVNYLKKVVFEILQDHEVYISIFCTDAVKMRELNYQFRNKDYATNVLSFPETGFNKIITTDQHNNSISELEYIGEVVLCWDIIKKEAQTYKFSFKKRCTHMLIHGILHLLGYAHHIDCDRIIMERIESSIMLNLNLGNPYEY